MLNALGSLAFAYSFAQVHATGSRRQRGLHSCPVHGMCMACSCTENTRALLHPCACASLFPSRLHMQTRQVLLEIQDTLRQPPPAGKTMKKARRRRTPVGMSCMKQNAACERCPLTISTSISAMAALGHVGAPSGAAPLAQAPR